MKLARKKCSILTPDGTVHKVEYDREAECIICHLPVVSASMGGTDVCPWCDCGAKGDDVPGREARLAMIASYPEIGP